MSASTGKPSAPPIPRSRTWLFLPILLPYAFLLHRFWFVADDAFISFRYSRNLALGHGLRYNLGSADPIEGYSNFLWVILCSVFERLRMSITVWPLLVSCACGVTALWLVFDLLQRRLRVGTEAAALATLSLACFPPFALWSTGGLATMPFALLLLVTFERLALRRSAPDLIGGSIAGLLLALVRLEGIAWFAVILVLALAVRRLSREPGRRALLKCALVVGAGFACYYAWRTLYFGAALPNTAYAKAELDGPRLLRGLGYAGTHFATFVSPFLVVAAAWSAFRRGRRPVGPALLLLTLAFPGYAILVTGDFMPMGRFLLPAAIFQTLLLGWLLQDLRAMGAATRGLSFALAAAAIVAEVLPAFNLHVVPEALRSPLFFRYSARERLTEYEAWQAQVENTREWGELGRALAGYAGLRTFNSEHPTYVRGAIGAVGYYSGLDILDWHGLVTPRVAHRPLQPGEPLRSPGHDKEVDISFFAQDEPTIALAQIDLEQPNTPRLIADRLREVTANLKALQARRRIPPGYVTDVARVDAPSTDDGPRYIVTWVRLAALADPARAETEIRDRVRTLESGQPLDPPPQAPGR